MTQQQKNLWPQLTAERRYLAAALITALAVHGILLLLFQPQPVTGDISNDELAKVGRLALDAPGSGAMVRWMQNHDPALMTAPDQKRGYSQVLNDFRGRQKLEDLPLPLHLNVPRQLELARLPENAAPRTNLLASRPAPELKQLGKAVPALQIYLNGTRQTKLPKSLQRLSSADSMPQLTGNTQRKLLIQVLPPRLENLERQLLVQQSSGVKKLDALAMTALRNALLQEPHWQPGINQVAFIWTGSAETVPEKGSFKR